MTKQDSLKIKAPNGFIVHSCVLKVNVDCDGCKDKVENLLWKINGVFSVNTDMEQREVAVTGVVDPSILIKRLKSSLGKHAILSGSKSMMFRTNKFKNPQPSAPFLPPPPPPPATELIDKILEEWIVPTSNGPPVRYYLIHWKGYSDTNVSWMTEEDLCGINPTLLESYRRSIT